MWAIFDVIDEPGTTSTVTYGFDFKRETGGTGSVYFGYSRGDGASWGWSSDILISCQEFYADPTSSVSSTGSLAHQFVHLTSNTQTTIDSTSFIEPSSDYRVTITPKSASSTIRVRYFVPCQPGSSYATNTIYTFRSFKIIGGAQSYALTSAGDVVGTRNNFAGLSIRPVGYDSNDPMFSMWDVIDEPGTTSAVTYGFDFKRETGGTGNVYFGFSAGDNADWGFSSDVIIVAEEIY